jgi:hypothetical protein
MRLRVVKHSQATRIVVWGIPGQFYSSGLDATSPCRLDGLMTGEKDYQTLKPLQHNTIEYGSSYRDPPEVRKELLLDLRVTPRGYVTPDATEMATCGTIFESERT